MTYSERSTQVALDSSIAVTVLLSHDNTDMEFWMLRPRHTSERDLTTREEFTARKLRSVGVIGLCGSLPRAAFKEALPSPVVHGIAIAFLEYLRVILAESFADEIRAVEIAELERLLTLPDTRLN
jgi:hypothetical protein